MLDQIAAQAQTHRLMPLGLCQRADAPLPEGVKTLVLLGPDQRDFWAHFTQSPEYRDGAPDPMDRWSERVIGAMAQALGGQAFFPFGTRPPHPFYTWALATGRIWSSPVQFLVHERAGLWVSFRGAIGFGQTVTDTDPPPRNPCDGCPAPCANACPVAALTPAGYDVAACHDYLDSAPGAACMSRGCAVRAVCPVSQATGRAPAHSAFHMRQFHR